MKNLIIPKKSYNLIEKSFKKNYALITKDWKIAVKESLNLKKAIERVSIINALGVGRKKILEIGSGSGVLLACLEKEGYECYGVEPDLLSYEASKYIFKKNKLRFKIHCCGAEKLPFRNNFFDIIISFQVIEHVRDVQEVFNECSRVLKKEGLIYFVIPNYFSFWEGHYGMFWFPLMPKRIASFYLKLKKKDDKFLYSLNYITPFNITKYCKKADIKIISMGEEIWTDRMIKANFETYAHTKKLKKVIKMLKFLKLNRLVAKLGIFFKFYYPIVLIARK